jgi:hypothetical protein
MATKLSEEDENKLCFRIKQDLATAIADSERIARTHNVSREVVDVATALSNLLTGTQKYLKDMRFHPPDDDSLPTK